MASLSLALVLTPGAQHNVLDAVAVLAVAGGRWEAAALGRPDAAGLGHHGAPIGSTLNFKPPHLSVLDVTILHVARVLAAAITPHLMKSLFALQQLVATLEQVPNVTDPVMIDSELWPAAHVRRIVLRSVLQV